MFCLHHWLHYIGVAQILRFIPEELIGNVERLHSQSDVLSSIGIETTQCMVNGYAIVDVKTQKLLSENSGHDGMPQASGFFTRDALLVQ